MILVIGMENKSLIYTKLNVHESVWDDFLDTTPPILYLRTSFLQFFDSRISSIKLLATKWELKTLLDGVYLDAFNSRLDRQSSVLAC